MAWNTPGDNNGKKDPWQGSNNESGPPDLDEALKKIYAKFAGFFGGKSSSKRGKNGTSGGGVFGIIAVIAILALLWALSGIFIVKPAERATVLRFGKYIETVQPGPHWIPRLIESYTKVNIKVNSYSYQALMLTKDENIVSVSMVVQYRVMNPRNYLYNVASAQQSLQQATASALRQVIGDSKLDPILTTGREAIRQAVSVQITKILDNYKAGLYITDVAMQPAKAPEEVKAAFDDAIKAQEDEQRYINQAQAYAMGVVPKARGQAKRLEQESQAYQAKVVLDAKGNVAGYLALLPQYKQSPQVMRERLYLDTLESVFKNTGKVLVDTNSSHNLLYLPLDKLLQQAGASSTSRLVSPDTTAGAATIPLRSTGNNSLGGYGDANSNVYQVQEVKP